MSDATYEAIAVWSQVASSIIFIAVLVWLWLKYIQPMVLASQARKNAELADAEARRDAALAGVQKAKDEVTAAATDANAIAARAQNDAATVHDRIVSEARAEGERLIRNAGGELERGRAAAHVEMRSELLAAALRIARGDAAKLDASVDKRLVDETVDVADRGART